jgi:hypothetical protein
MGLIIGLVFIGVFAVDCLPWIAQRVGPSKQGQGGAGQAGLGAGHEAPEQHDRL